MQYTVKGLIYEREAAVTWEDGCLTGDRLAIDFLRLEAKLAEGRDIGPVGGPYNYTDHLSDPVATYFLLSQQVFTDVIEYMGDALPERPDLPEGAIG